jgi:hypothetical protein
MRLAVLGEGYATAVDAFATGSRIGARASTTLGDRLAGYAAMAGDDATAAEFAASYDEAAAAAAHGVAELAAAFASAGRLAAASLVNHHGAEVASGGQPPWRLPETPGLVELMATTPPSALGADTRFLPGWASMVLDLLEGAVWPDADTDRLREAATTWRTAARSVALLGAHCSTATAGFEGELSPEIPVAVAATLDLRRQVETLADQLAAIADACDTYAEQVDAKRDQMLDLLEELGIELGIGAVVGAALSFLSAGLAAGATSAAASGRIAAASRELKVIVEALRILNGSTAATLRPVTTTLRDTRSSLARLLRVDLARADERGVIALGRSGRFPRGWLSEHEAAGGHVVARHVGKSDEELLARLSDEPFLPNSSSFADEDQAERLLERFLTKQSGSISAWLNAGGRQLRLDGDVGGLTGRTAWPSGIVEDVCGVRVVLVRDSSMSEGYRILTAFPQP